MATTFPKPILKRIENKVVTMVPSSELGDLEKKAEAAMQEALSKGMTMAEAAKIRKSIYPRKMIVRRGAARWALGSDQ